DPRRHAGPPEGRDAERDERDASRDVHRPDHAGAKQAGMGVRRRGWRGTVFHRGGHGESCFGVGKRYRFRRTSPGPPLAFRVRTALRERETQARVEVVASRGAATRTLNLRFWRPLLYQLSYTPRAKSVEPRAKNGNYRTPNRSSLALRSLLSALRLF